MTAVEDLEVKLAIVKHVIDAAYWHMPVGSPIVAHPKLRDLQEAPIGSRLGDPGGGGWMGPSLLKTGPDTWQAEAYIGGRPSTASSEQVARAHNLRHTKLAVPKGAVSRGEFRDLFGTNEPPRSAFEEEQFAARKTREAARAAYESAHPEVARSVAAYEQSQRAARRARERALQTATTGRALARAV